MNDRESFIKSRVALKNQISMFLYGYSFVKLNETSLTKLVKPNVIYNFFQSDRKIFGSQCEEVLKSINCQLKNYLGDYPLTITSLVLDKG